MPGKSSSPFRIFCIRFFRISSLTGRTLYPLSRNSPIVRGRVLIVIRFCATFLVGLVLCDACPDREQEQSRTLRMIPLTNNGWNHIHSTASNEKAQGSRSRAEPSWYAECTAGYFFWLRLMTT